MTTIKILFRFKSARNVVERGSVKVFTNVRVERRVPPRQVHLGYVPAMLQELRSFDRDRLTEKLKVAWIKLFGNDDVEIDWEDARMKWQHRNEPREWRVNRQKALDEIQIWFADESFAIAYLELHRYLSSKIKGFDTAEIANWWESEAAPRLFFCYLRYVKRKGMPPSPDGFLDYLQGNIRLGYATKDFLRVKWDQIRWYSLMKSF